MHTYAGFDFLQVSYWGLVHRLQIFPSLRREAEADAPILHDLSCPNLGIKSLKSSIRRQYISVTPLVGHLQTEGQINTQQLQRSLLRPLGWRLELPVENRNATREQGRLQFRRLL